MKKVYRVFAVLLVMTMLLPATFVFGEKDASLDMNVGIENLEWAGAEVEVTDSKASGDKKESDTKVYGRRYGGYLTTTKVSDYDCIISGTSVPYTTQLSGLGLFIGPLSSSEVPSAAQVKGCLEMNGKMPTKSGEYTFYYHRILGIYWGSPNNIRYYFIPSVAWKALGDSGKKIKFGDKEYNDYNIRGGIAGTGEYDDYKKETYNIPIKIKIQTAPLEVWHKWDDGEERVHDTTVYVGSSFNFSSHKYLPAVKWVGKTKYTLRNFKVMSGTTTITNYNLTVDSSGEITQKSLDEYTGVVREKRYTKNSKETLKFVLTYKKAIPVKKVSLDFELRLATGEPDYQKYTVHDTGLKDGLESGKQYKISQVLPKTGFIKSIIKKGRDSWDAYRAVVVDSSGRVNSPKSFSQTYTVSDFLASSITAGDSNSKVIVYYKKRSINEDKVPVYVEVRKATGDPDYKNYVVVSSGEQGKYAPSSRQRVTSNIALYDNGVNGKVYRAVVQSRLNTEQVTTFRFSGWNDFSMFKNTERNIGKKGINVILYCKPSGGAPSGGGGSGGSGGGSGSGGSSGGSSNTVDYLTPIGQNGVIAADTRGAEKFDVSQGIPVTEDEYTCVISQRYLVKYTIKSNTGTTQHTASCMQPTPKGPVTNTWVESRTYRYYTVSDLQIYDLDHAVIENYSFNGNKVRLDPIGHRQVTYSLNRTGGVKEYPKQLGNCGAVTQYKVQNDTLVIDGHTVLSAGSGNNSHESGPSTLARPSNISNTVLFRSGLTIPMEKLNGVHESDGTVVYRKVVGSGSQTLEFKVPVNSVTIHTPVVTYPKVSDEKKWNQMVNPDKSVTSLVLGRPFRVTVPSTGQHRNIRGYGNRDYKKYIRQREVAFTFGVRIGPKSSGKYVKPGTWIVLDNNGIGDFYVPHWVKEGYHSVKCRTIAVNREGYGNDDEKKANIQLENYVSYDSVKVQISGRLFAFRVYDVTDYPMWQRVFRNKDWTMTGKQYLPGYFDRNKNRVRDNNSKFVLPIMECSNPYGLNTVPLGYSVRYKVNSMGNYEDKNSTVRVTVDWWYVPKAPYGKVQTVPPRPVPVDVYYDSTLDLYKDGGYRSQYVKLVPISSNLNKMNKESWTFGKEEYGVNPKELRDTERVYNMQRGAMGLKTQLMTKYGDHEIPWKLRTFIGTTAYLPQSIDWRLAKMRAQTWHYEIRLPSEIHVCDKGFDIKQYARTHGRKDGMIDFKEPFWKNKQGFLIATVGVAVYKDGKPWIQYQNKANEPFGYANMWKIEGHRTTGKDCDGNVFQFPENAVVMFDMNQSAKKDYSSGGFR